MAYAMIKFGMSSGTAAWHSTRRHLTIQLNRIAACSSVMIKPVLPSRFSQSRERAVSWSSFTR